MANMLEDGMTAMLATLLANAGSDCIYNNNAGPVRMHKRPQQPVLMDSGNGKFTEILMTDFITNPTLQPFIDNVGEPKLGDQIDIDGETYRVQQMPAGKVYRKMANSLMRIHTVRVM